MADDGMLMNLAVDAAPLKINTVFKGGSWKARLQAKKTSQRRRESKPESKLERNGLLTGVNAIPTQPRPPLLETQESRPSKRQKLCEPHGHSMKPHNRTAKSTEVVSSLFTSNPKSKALPSEKENVNDDPALEPSNAPLPATASPFTSLGLSASLSTHLTQSLNLTAPTAIQKTAITQLLREDSDAFIQAETGSGKTLAYLLPIIQRLTSLLKENKIDRSSGLFALILAPTRELTHQISAVLERLLRYLPYLVAGTVTGGSRKNHEKSRLRKGLNILVATPGRLVDHLENTKSLDLTNVRWLVLDEGDRLMELGFEEEIKSVVKHLDIEKVESYDNSNTKKVVEGLPRKRTTVLCSATMKMGVQKLGEISLKDAVHIKAEPAASQATIPQSPKGDHLDVKKGDHIFLAPAQLRQSFLVTAPKQRLVTLAALLKRTFARRGSVMKAIVFLSCADSVDFHFDIFARSSVQSSQEPTNRSDNEKGEIIVPKKNRIHVDIEELSKGTATTKETTRDLPTVARACALASVNNPDLTLFKLHGSLEQKIRTATLQRFARSADPEVLLCTDVASRGLDLPNVDLVIEYDPPFSADDHLHRIGRTARAGQDGRAICFLMPREEEGYISVLKECAGAGAVKGENAEEVLMKGFSTTRGVIGKSGKWDQQATDWQLDVERWVIDNNRASEMARKAFISHVRAYSTHVAKERSIFDVKALHLGHLAKAFALRDRPGNVGRGGNTLTKDEIMSEKGRRERRTTNPQNGKANAENHGVEKAVPMADDGQDAARKMRAKMKEHMSSVSEFNIG